MGFKAYAQKVSDAHYVLPKTAEMQVEVHAFLSENLYNASEESVWQQAVESASYPGVRACYLMPDCHKGYGIPIGGVVVTDNTIIQSGSGFDISCGVVYLTTPLTAEDVQDWDTRLRWVREVEKRVATGKGVHQAPLARKFKQKLVDEILHYGAKPLGIDADLCERQFIEIPKDLDVRKIERAYNKVGFQLGSVGGGNHFIELQVDRDTGKVWAMIHCGSRGYGWQTANHFFHEGAKLRGLPKARKESAHLYADEPLGKEYWAHHNSAANFAVANRHIIVEAVNDALQEVFGVTGTRYYEISHNLVQEETFVAPDGKHVKGFVHRKGATRAFPAGHPDLIGTKWEKTGHPCLIPGSMMAGAAILFPLEGAYKSGCSVNHGSGRTMARGQAKKDLASLHDDIDDEMRTIKRTFGPDQVEIVGIVGNRERTPLDECGHVYKDLDAVLEVLTTEGIARMEHRLYPVANIKGE